MGKLIYLIRKMAIGKFKIKVNGVKFSVEASIVHSKGKTNIVIESIYIKEYNVLNVIKQEVLEEIVYKIHAKIK